MNRQIGHGLPIEVERYTLREAQKRDIEEPLRHLRDEFLIPTREDLANHSSTPSCKYNHNLREAPGTDRVIATSKPSELSTYLCGNSLGVQPKRMSQYVNAQLTRWRTKGVFGHFKEVKGSLIPPWLDLDELVSEKSARIVGALPSEVAIMQTLTANLHIMMASFYRPTKDRYKIIFEGKAFPSDHYVVESQIRHHNLSISEAMVLIEPPPSSSLLLPTEHILKIIDEHAESTALLLLPGIQFYSGQFFDIKTITAHAQSKGIVVGWDLAHAAGNVPLQLHDWNVDFAAWCNYKYLNCGPGAIGGVFVHERHGRTAINGEQSSDTEPRPRLTGWWGSTKSARFAMTNEFIPIPGAGGYQLSNPSAIDMAAVLASLTVFEMTNMQDLRDRSVRLTGYLEGMLDASPESVHWKVITPRVPDERGAQLSLKLEPGLLDVVLEHLEDEGVVVDERKPDVIRVAPAPLYNNFEDCWRFVHVWREGVNKAVAARTSINGSHDAANGT